MALYAFDGTWNDSRDPARDQKLDTNVYRFYRNYRENSKCHKFYLDGVGSRKGWMGRLIGGLTGAGAAVRVREQFQHLQQQFQQGDSVIDIVGYSRGAAIARLFVQHIEAHFEQLTCGQTRLSQPPTIRFLGLFDTVASFGVPWREDTTFRREIPEFVQHTFHAMALDETRETFGIERCRGDRGRITEVWFRGGHGDIGGNATLQDKHHEQQSNLARSNIALNWLLAKAHACGLPVTAASSEAAVFDKDAPVTAKDELIRIGEVGTLSRRIHLGDLVHHTVEKTYLTSGIDGRQLRRINVPVRIEDEDLEKSGAGLNWVPAVGIKFEPDNESPGQHPSLRSLSTRLNPFDVPPARTWQAWLKLWELDQLQPAVIDDDRMLEFWSPTDADRALAWDIYVELATRIAVEELKDTEGNSKTALESIAKLFTLTRDSLKCHGIDSANAGTLITAFLNRRVRSFTAYWHPLATKIDENGEKKDDFDPQLRQQFRQQLRKEIQPVLTSLAKALSSISGKQL